MHEGDACGAEHVGLFPAHGDRPETNGLAALEQEIQCTSAHHEDVGRRKEPLGRVLPQLVRTERAERVLVQERHAAHELIDVDLAAGNEGDFRGGARTEHGECQ